MLSDKEFEIARCPCCGAKLAIEVREHSRIEDGTIYHKYQVCLKRPAENVVHRIQAKIHGHA